MILRRSVLLLIVSAALPLAGCTAEATEIPQRVAHTAGQSPVDSAKAFLDARYKVAFQVLENFDLYLAAATVRSQALKSEWFDLASKFRHNEAQASTSMRLRAFVESPDGAYLSAQDREFLSRYEDRLKKEFAARRQAIETGPRARALPDGVSAGYLFGILSNASDATRWFKSRSHAFVEALVKAVAAEILVVDDRKKLLDELDRFPSAQAEFPDELVLGWLRATTRVLETIRTSDPDAKALGELSWALAARLVIQSIVLRGRSLPGATMRADRLDEFVGQLELNEFQMRVRLGATAIKRQSW